MSEYILKAENIGISFGGIRAVDSVSFEIKKGEIVSIIGPNGAGKTTVFNLLTGVYKLGSGSVEFNGNDISNLRPEKIVNSGLSRTFQNIRLVKDMKVIENVLIGTHVETHYTLGSSIFKTRGFKKKENESLKEVLKTLDMLNLYDKKDSFASDLPYGDQRKVEIARAIATGAELILLDEPAAGMNPTESAELLAFIRKLRDMGYTILMIEHDMSVVMNISDRIYVLDNGKKIAEGLPEEVANDECVIKAYLGGTLDA